MEKRIGTHLVDVQINATNNRVSAVRDSANGIIWDTYVHDSRGNVTSNDKYNFQYDRANQPTNMSGPHSGVFTYDGNLKRVKQVVDGETIYSIYNLAGQLIARDNITKGETTDYATVAGETFIRIKNGAVLFPLNDHLGTAYKEVDQSGNTIAGSDYNYTPFGETWGSAGPGENNKQGFTGHIEDSSGLVYMQARYYDPVIGRFLQADPVGYADNMNLYAYVGSDPMNKVDPFGLAETGGNCGRGDGDSNCGEVEVTGRKDGSQECSGCMNLTGDAARDFVSGLGSLPRSDRELSAWEPTHSDAVAGAMQMAIRNGDAANQALSVIGFSLAPIAVVESGGFVIVAGRRIAASTWNSLTPNQKKELVAFMFDAVLELSGSGDGSLSRRRAVGDLPPVIKERIVNSQKK